MTASQFLSPALGLALCATLGIRFAYDDGEVIEKSFRGWEQDKDFVIIDDSAFYIPSED